MLKSSVAGMPSSFDFPISPVKNHPLMIRHEKTIQKAIKEFKLRREISDLNTRVNQMIEKFTAME